MSQNDKNVKTLIILFCLLFSLFSSGQSMCTTSPVLASPIMDGQCNEATYVLIFEDEFNGTTLDSNKWNIVQGVVRDPQHEHEQQWYSDDNIDVSDGTLKLKATKEPVFQKTYSIWEDIGPVTYTQNFEYKSASIESKHKFETGIVEMRCKVPKGVGFFPAFWLYGGGPPNEYGMNDFSEIDIWEMWNPHHDITGELQTNRLAEEVYFNIHHYDPGTGGNVNCPGFFYDGTDFSQDFHTFTCVWDGYKIEWYIDGDLKYRVTRWLTVQGQQVDCSSLAAFGQYLVNRQFPDDPMNIIANFAISSEPGSGAPDASSIFPANFEIDYIKYWQQPSELIAVFEYDIYPNPTNGLITISINKADISGVQLAIMNVLGETVYANNVLEDNSVEVDLTALAKGVYIVLIFDPVTNQVYSDKVVYL